MELAGHTCLGHVEIDRYANKSYEAIFGKEDLIGSDITKITDDEWRKYRGKVDCICGGFPCQAFSIAGNRRGFEDTRGTLFFEICTAAKEIKPSYLFLENVKGLLSHNAGETFKTMLLALDELGYDAEWKVLNSKNFGGNPQVGRVYSPDGISPCLNTMQGGSREPKIIQKARGYNKAGEFDVSPTISKSSWEQNNFLERDFKIRKLTPRECWRLQSFPDLAFDRASKVNSDSQLYKQAGNSVTVNVIKFITERMRIEKE